MDPAGVPFLVTELMNRGSLKSTLYDQPDLGLTWSRRLNFLIDAASGIGAGWLVALAKVVHWCAFLRFFALAVAYSSRYQERQYAFGRPMGTKVGGFWHGAHRDHGWFEVVVDANSSR